MKLSTRDFPQADRLHQVGEVARAVASGHTTDMAIEAALGLDSDGRQGRYYRHAAVRLGLINNFQNISTLTPLGQEFSEAGVAGRTEVLARCLVDAPVFRDALSYVEKHTPTDKQLKLWFRSIFPGSPNTADRRFSTLLSYLHETHLISRDGDKNKLAKFNGAVAKVVLSASQPILPSFLTGGVPAKSPPHFADATKLALLQQNSLLLERASTIHWKLIDAKATVLRDRGITPQANANIDLFGVDNGKVVIFEMKSVNDQGSNHLQQVRRAVAQLYEYRYIYGASSAVLSIVTNRKLSTKNDWLAQYLAADRSIAYEWSEDFKSFKSDPASLKVLSAF